MNLRVAWTQKVSFREPDLPGLGRLTMQFVERIERVFKFLGYLDYESSRNRRPRQRGRHFLS
jgi:hypothetical protein